MNNTSLGHFYAKFPILARAKYNQLGREERCSLSKL